MALPDVIQVTSEELLKWSDEIHHWATLMEKKGDDELAKKSYAIASLLFRESKALDQPAANDMRTMLSVWKGKRR